MSRRRRAFTLIELLVVIAIIGMLAAIGIPAVRGFRKGDTMRAAVRQLLDEAAYARLRALNDHTTVYMVFVPPALGGAPQPWFNQLTNSQQRQFLEQQLTSYALYVPRQVGDQPGRPTPRYITPWRTLPEGIFIPPRKFTPRHPAGQALFPEDYATFNSQVLPYPNVGGVLVDLPCVTFTYQGGLASRANEVIPLARGSIMLGRDANGPVWSLDAHESPLGNSINTYNHVVIDWLTGRAHVDIPKIQ